MSLLERVRDARLSDRSRPVVTVVLAVLAVVIATGWAVVAAVAAGRGAAPADYDVFGGPGADLLTGRWGGLFRDPVIQAGPFELALWGVPHLLGVQGVAGWSAAYAVLSLLLAAAVALVVHRVVRGRTPDAVPIALGASVLVLAVGVVTTSVTDGHPAEVAVPLLWIAAALLARGGHPLGAGLVIGATAGWELWGLLGAAVLLLAPARPVRALLWGAAGAAAAVALLFGPFVALGPFRMFEYHWLVRSGSLPALWLAPGHDTFPWQLRILQGGLALAASAVVAILVRAADDAVWLVALVACAVRLVFDPVLAGYYFEPPVILIAVALALAVARRSIVDGLLALLLLNLALDLHDLVGVGACLLLGGVAGVAVRIVIRARRAHMEAPA